MNVVIIAIIPINGNKKALTTPASTPTLIIIIENSPRGAANVNADLNDLVLDCLKMKLPSRFPPNYMPIATAISAIAMKI